MGWLSSVTLLFLLFSSFLSAQELPKDFISLCQFRGGEALEGQCFCRKHFNKLPWLKEDSRIYPKLESCRKSFQKRLFHDAIKAEEVDFDQPYAGISLIKKIEIMIQKRRLSESFSKRAYRLLGRISKLSLLQKLYASLARFEGVKSENLTDFFDFIDLPLKLGDESLEDGKVLDRLPVLNLQIFNQSMARLLEAVFNAGFSDLEDVDVSFFNQGKGLDKVIIKHFIKAVEVSKSWAECRILINALFRTSSLTFEDLESYENVPDCFKGPEKTYALILERSIYRRTIRSNSYGPFLKSYHQFGFPILSRETMEYLSLNFSEMTFTSKDKEFRSFLSQIQELSCKEDILVFKNNLIFYVKLFSLTKGFGSLSKNEIEDLKSLFTVLSTSKIPIGMINRALKSSFSKKIKDSLKG